MNSTRRGSGSAQLAIVVVAMVVAMALMVSLVVTPQSLPTTQTFQTVQPIQTVQTVQPIQTEQPPVTTVTVQPIQTTQSVQPIQETIAIAPAAALASEVKSLPLISDSSACPSVSAAVSNSIVVVQDMAGAFGVAPHNFQFDPSNCDVMVQYVPIVGSYDQLVTAARQFNPNNATSVEALYEAAFFLSSQLIIINDSVAYKIAFTSVGELNDDLGLATLRSYCGDTCYSVVLSGLHWTIRTYMDSLLCQFESYLSKYLPFKVQLWC